MSCLEAGNKEVSREASSSRHTRARLMGNILVEGESRSFV